MRNLVSVTMLAILVIMFSSPAVAINVRGLKWDPMQYFNDDDWKMMGDTFNNALDSNADGATSEWKNPDSGNQGSVTPTETYKNVTGHRCRRATVWNRARSFEDSYTFIFCNIDGTWKQVGTRELDLKPVK